MGATTNKKFDSQLQLLGEFAKGIPLEVIKNEPMFFNSDYTFAHHNGGPITKSFLEALPLTWRKEVVIDTRVHMLMPGWYPAIPGFHHDDIFRSEETGQPNYDCLKYEAEHIMGLVNGDVCPTQFAIGECEMPAVPKGETIYKKWHTEVARLLKEKKLELVGAPSNRLIYFDWQTFHTGDKALQNGWRWFGRVSRNTDRTQQITNEIRNQVQVYLEFPMEGW